MAEQGPVQQPLEISVLENQLHVPNIDEVCRYLETPGVNLSLLNLGSKAELPMPLDRLKISAENNNDRLGLTTVARLAPDEFPEYGEQKFKHYFIGGRSDTEKSTPVDAGFERKDRPTETSGFVVYKSPITGLKTAISLFKNSKSQFVAEITNRKRFPHDKGRPVGYSIKPRHTKGIETEEYIKDFLTISMLALSALVKYSAHNENLSLRASFSIPEPHVDAPEKRKPKTSSATARARREAAEADLNAEDELVQSKTPTKRQLAIPEEELINENETRREIVRLSDIGGLEDVKQQIWRIALVYNNPDIAALWDSPAARTILFYGPAGTGKTSLAQAMAHEIGADFRSVSSTEINNMYVGNTGKNMEKLFDDLCEVEKPTVVLFDEFDTIIQPKNSGSNEKAEAAGIFKRRMNTLTEDNPNIILVGTTNNDQDITPDFKRRFKKRIYVPRPDEKAREQIWRIKIGPLLAKDADEFKPFGDISLSELNEIIAELAKQTEGMTGSDITDAFNLLKEDKMEEHILTGSFTPIRKEDFLAALNNIRTQ